MGVALGVLFGSGCSWVGVTPVTRVHTRDADPPCTRSVALPVVDTVIAGSLATLAVASVVGATQPERHCDDTMGNFCFDLDLSGFFVAVAITSGVLAGVHTASAVYGYETTADCRRVTNARQRAPLHAPSAASAGFQPRELSSRRLQTPSPRSLRPINLSATRGYARR